MFWTIGQRMETCWHSSPAWRSLDCDPSSKNFGEESMDNSVIAAFKQTLRGRMIERGDPDYDEERALYNAMIDKRPLMIARCADVADVIASVNFGRDNGLLIAIRGGGHNGPGLGSCNDGLVIDLSMMKGVRVDAAAATVRVGPGCTSGDVDHATHAFGLAVPFGIVSTTGVAGLTLGGPDMVSVECCRHATCSFIRVLV